MWWKQNDQWETGNSGYGMVQALKNSLCTQPTTEPIIHTMGKRNSAIGRPPLIDMPWEREYRILSNSSKALGERWAALIKSPTQLGEAKRCYCHREKWWLLWTLTGGGNLRRPFSPSSCEPVSNQQRKVFYLHMSWEDGVMDVLEAVVSPAVELLAWNKGRGVKIASALNQCEFKSFSF